MSNHRKRLVELFVKELSRGSFTDYLGIRQQLFAPIVDPHSISFSYKIPAHICLPYKGRPCITASATMALFDEYSSMCFMMKDKGARGGVSIMLTADVHQFCAAGTDVTIVTRATKVGKTIGFCDIEMFDHNKELVSRGSHVKFVDMGRMWDFAMHPSRISTTLALYDALGERLLNTAIGDNVMSLLGKGKRLSDLSPAFGEVGAAYREFGLSSEGADQREGGGTQAHFKMKPHMGNYFGNLHGGAAAMLAEECSVRASAGESQSRHINTIVVCSFTCKADIRNATCFSSLSDLFAAGGRITSMDMKYLTPMTVGRRGGPPCL